MNSIGKRLILLTMVLGGFATAVVLPAYISAAPQDKSIEEMIDYKRDILPIISTKCFRCHGMKKQEGGLRLDGKKRFLEGGDSGPAVQLGKSNQSELMRRVTTDDENTRMPSEGAPLSKKQIALLRNWIDQGAKGISDVATTGDTSGHWAFQPIRRPTPPNVVGTKWVRNPIDRFVLAKLETQDIQPAQAASHETLIRRLYLDLTGLPPEWDRVKQFLDDTRPNAYELLVDELLASPHYGERWGRHWLDVARYADSSGYESDTPRDIWPYRDWVIGALNRDHPFDQFVIEQIAGDLLPAATAEQRIATGFHCNAIFDPGVRWESIIDRVNTTGTVFLGLTTGCAQCHSHKTDPITQREFYQLYAFFNEATMDKLELAPPGIAKADSKPTTTSVMKQVARVTNIFVRGDHDQPGQQVMPGVPAFLNDLQVADKEAPNRLDLARWLIADNNPLTARVTVNRIWQRYFGLGLVETENDFGVQTPQPLHAKLLDFLADDFRSGGWSLKRLHRLIVTSSTYRQSSTVRRELKTIDPRNRLLARQRRLRVEAEIIRDVALTSSGLLSRKLGGPSVFPYQPEGILNNRATPAVWTMSEGENRYRRGMYTWVWRLTPHPHLPLFDLPDGIASCTKRDRSNVPVQALTLLNDPTFLECARKLAVRVLGRSTASDDERISRLFRTCLSRDPQLVEIQLVTKLLQKQRLSLATNQVEAKEIIGDTPVTEGDISELAAWVVVCRTILNLDEFITRE
jgi:hypothetical protein